MEVFFFNREYCVLGSSNVATDGLAWINAYSKFLIWLFFRQDVGEPICGLCDWFYDALAITVL